MCSYVLMSLLILLSKRLSATLLMRQIFLIYEFLAFKMSLDSMD